MIVFIFKTNLTNKVKELPKVYIIKLKNIGADGLRRKGITLYENTK